MYFKRDWLAHYMQAKKSHNLLENFSPSNTYILAPETAAIVLGKFSRSKHQGKSLKLLLFCANNQIKGDELMFALNSGDCLGLSDVEHTVQVAFTTVYTCMVHSIWFIL